MAQAEPITSPHPSAPEAARKRVTAAVNAVTGALVDLSQDLHAHPEEGFAEHRSVRVLADPLAKGSCRSSSPGPPIWEI